MKTNIYLILTLLILTVLPTTKINAQPYYFYDKTGIYDSTIYEETIDIYRVNLATGDEQLFTENIHYPNSYTWDNYQKWFILNQPRGIYFYRPWSNIAIDSLSVNALEDFGLMVFSIDSLGCLFVGWAEPGDSGFAATSNSTLLDLNTLQVIIVNASTYDNRSFVSKDLQYVYQYGGRDSLGVRYMFKFSIESDSVVEEISINNLFPSIEYPVFNDGKNGIALFGYNEIMTDSTTCKYITYDFDNELFSQEIPCPFRCYGHLISKAEYFILEQVLWDESKPGAEYSTGVIYLYKTKTGELLKTFSLPPDGKILLFDNYPNNVYYAIDIEEPTRQVYTLKMDSIFNVLDLTSLNPSSEIFNSPPFTLTVSGQGFDSLSTVFFNDTAKTTTYVSDSVLTAEIDSPDISVVGNYPVWVTDQWGTSDTLYFSVLPEPPVLSSITPSLALPVTSYSDNTDFTVTVTGANFNDSSMIYFNGDSKATTYISDSILTFQLNNYNDISSIDDYTVWLNSYGSNSDTVYFSVTDNLPESLISVVNCVRNNGDKTFTAFFGYNNSNNESVFISIGGDNFFSPIQLFSDRGQPNIFLPGVHSNVFSVVFNGDNLPWYLNGTSATANKRSTPCP
ncbi:MAG: hypothetical protein DAHOPDDO_00172 [Ignavibacteriaceae bacterium]|nr:hypothetical protein [Ignavibacteriaceae bacterium]